MTLSGITQPDRSGWQQRAAGELVPILDAHGDLPVIAWTVGPAGSTLVGQIHGLARAGRARDLFDAWRTALPFTEHHETVGEDGTTFLRASVTRNLVLLVLTATVFNDVEAQR